MPQGQIDEPAGGPADGRTDRRPAGELEASVLAALWAAARTPGASAAETRIQAAAEGAPGANQDLLRAVEGIGRARATAFATAICTSVEA